MLFQAATTRSFTVPASPDDVAAYFSCNAELLAALIRGGEVVCLEPGLYRVQLGSFTLPGLHVRPELDVAFDNLPGRTEMRTLRVHLLDGPSGLSMAVRFEGEARFEEHPAGCLLVCTARAQVRAECMGTARLAGAWLDAPGSALLTAIMDATARRFERLMASHFAQQSLAAA